MTRHFVRRRPLLSLLLVLLVLLLGWGWQQRVALSAFPDILSAYTAKEYCSCRYVAGLSAPYCQGYVKQYLPISGFVDDTEHKQVTASGLGRTHIAQWLGVREGCRLLP
ncbi:MULTISPECIES: amidase [Pseudomonas]|jgi:hypothetical protein|uniref:Amidase n=1 Tax=Pseudomonas kielensis TaxID=2762577 RepID=A0A7X1KZN0_9PSED|nr:MULTISPECIES: amidase [Pseudomonas]MBC2692813.1 amidase [Pseudomonas kielensis]NBB36848.1 amidase [Pseudomonas sp. BC115LW]UZM14201.1 amidase [Pseudomonas kielensis]WKL53772.1 amidase [Pseudomonas kielensis]